MYRVQNVLSPLVIVVNRDSPAPLIELRFRIRALLKEQRNTANVREGRRLRMDG
jgi:hypothetical protein